MPSARATLLIGFTMLCHLTATLRADERPATAAGDESSLITIKAQMVGTFYVAPKPGAKPFVTVGSDVDEETDAYIIEAMKNITVFKAECRGTIMKILAQDGQPVQFDQPLFLVKPK